MTSFDIMLQQCEKQAEKLCTIEIDEKYCDEVDVFTSYFEQLKQIIENNNIENINKRVEKLLSLLNTFTARMESEKNIILAKTESINKNKSMLHYGTSKCQTSFRINRRY